MKEKFVMGMDGGGTATNVSIADRNGNIINEFRIGSLNINGQTVKITEETLKEGLLKVKALGLRLEDCLGICIGAAGLSNPETKTIVTRTLRENGIRSNITIVGDHETALAGAIKGEGTCGVILIAGTGSICFGINENGESYRAGGYGHFIDDEGSAYAIGRDILKAVVRGEDKRGCPTCFTEAVFERLQINNCGELIGWLYAKDRSKKEIAALAVLMEEAIKKGDKAANKILRSSALELAELAKAVFLHFEKPPLLVVSGSVLLNNKEIFDLFSQIIKMEYPAIEIVKMRGNAAQGAVKIALREVMHEEILGG